MNEGEFSSWLAGCSPEQELSLRALRALVKENSEELSEDVNSGKWLAGYIFYSKGSRMLFAMSPQGKARVTFHMMPYYGSPQLQLRYQGDLKPFLTGKSCIAFKNFSELPRSALVAIVREGSAGFLKQL